MPSDITTQPHFLNARTNIYTAWDLRRASALEYQGAGVSDYNSFHVVQRAAGANMSVDVGSSNIWMYALVRGSTRQAQGLYVVDNIDTTAPAADTYLAAANLIVSANSSGNPRIDQVVLVISDSQHAGANNKAYADILAGTPTGGATLDNRSGVASLPASSLLLADVLVANGAASITNTEIRDRRHRTWQSSIPILPGDAWPITVPRAITTSNAATLTSAVDLRQSALLFDMPVWANVSNLRWQYVHGGTALTGNYFFGIYDSSGRKLTDTGSVAFTGAANSFQVRNETLTPTVSLEPGKYWLVFGIDTTNGGTVTTAAAQGTLSTSSIPVAAIGTFLYVATGGVTIPTTILNFADISQLTSAATATPVPLVTLVT